MSDSSIARTAAVGPYRVGAGERLLVVAGPCVIESLELTLDIAVRLRQIAAALPIQLVFKASFDKANRTSLSSYRGPGLEAGLAILARVRRETGLPITTDIHEPSQAAAAAEVCDLLQIPAFLCRQTDLLAAAARTGRAVHVKKAQFLAPGNMRHVVGKLRAAGCNNILLCERGTFFGFGRLVNDMRAWWKCGPWERPSYSMRPTACRSRADWGHATGGNRAMVEPLARAAVAVGVDGLFFETHPTPDTSPSDGPNMLPLDAFGDLIARLLKVREAVEGFD